MTTTSASIDSEQHRRESWLGSARITPVRPAIAGEYGTWVVDYTVGIAGIDDGGSLRLAFRTVSDWPAAQFTDPAAENHVSARASGDRVTLTPTFGLHGVRPWSRTVTFRVGDGALAAGERIAVTLGDTSGGGPGMRAQTFPETRFRIKVQADPFGTGVFEDVDTLGFPIVGGPAVTLVLTAPSDLVEGETGWLQIRAIDRWGNPDPAFDGSVRLSRDVPDGVPRTYTFHPDEHGVHRFDDVRFPSGIERPLRVAACLDDGPVSLSNPIRVHASRPEHRVYWGDLHGQTEETVGTGSIDEYFAYARDIAAVDVAAHSGNDFQLTNEVYARLRDAVERFHDDGRFVTLHGYEWSGNTPAGGDHNVYYRDGGPIRRSSHALIDDTSDASTDCYPIDRLYAANAGRTDVLLTPHVGGRRANLDFHDPDLEPAIEIASQWGRFEWFAREALERQLQVAFIAGSDDHSGRPGWSAPTLAHHGVRGGLTAFLADDLSRGAIWDALGSRRCYGTSGPRMLVDISVSGHPMGSAPVLAELPDIAVHVVGTAPIDTIELRRGLDTVYRHDARPRPVAGDPWRVRVAWRGARNRDRSRALDWSGELLVRHGQILDARNHAIDNPLEGIVAWNAGSATWRSHTCGDWDGIILDLDGDDDTRLEVRTPAVSCAVTLGEIAGNPRAWEGRGLEQQLVIERLAHAHGPMETGFAWRDSSPEAGVNPYWIWVTQSDGELGWSSPVYVTYEPELSETDPTSDRA